MMAARFACVAGVAVLSLFPTLSQQSKPSWAALDAQVSGNETRRLEVLDTRLEAFLRESVLVVAPQADVVLTDPDADFGLGGHGACDVYTVEGTRDATVSGLSVTDRGKLHSRIVRLWRSLGISVIHDSQNGTHDFIVVHGFGFEADSTPSGRFHIVGSTPCLTNDATLAVEQSYRRIMFAGVVGGLVTGALAVIAALVAGRRHMASALASARTLGRLCFEASVVITIYGIVALGLHYFNRNAA